MSVLVNAEMKTQFIEKNLIGLNRFQRIFLTADGTVTELLEQYFNEPVKLIKLYEKIEDFRNQLPLVHQSVVMSTDMPVLKRKVLLQGLYTENNRVYAESSILLGNLSQPFRQDLLISTDPIGKLWAKYRCETYKTILQVEREVADGLAEYFNVEESDEIISRTYSVYSSGKMVMVITEKTPVL